MAKQIITKTAKHFILFNFRFLRVKIPLEEFDELL